MKSHYEVVIVGGSVAAESFVSTLADLHGPQDVLVVDRDARMPYERPPLSKGYLSNPDNVEVDVEWEGPTSIVHAEATSVDVGRQSLLLRTDTGIEQQVGFDRLVIATGAQPNHLPFEPKGVLSLRSIHDTENIRISALRGSKVGIIGAGAIGVELASTLRAMGCEVAVVDQADRPLERLLAGHLGDTIAMWMEDLGIRTFWKATIQAINGEPGRWTVKVAGEPDLEVNTLISAVGSRPDIGWLAGSGLLTNGQLLCDEDGRVLFGDLASNTIFGAGDVVTRQLADGTTTRTESWSAASEQGSQLAHLLSGTSPIPGTEIPYFWTDVAGRKIQVLGTPDPDGILELESENSARGSLLYKVTDAQQNVCAWIGINAAAQIAKLRMAGALGA